MIAIVKSNENTELYSSDTRKLFSLPTSSSLNTSIQSLIKKNLIQKENKTYKIINPVFKLWLQQLV